jgi:hypothetical protein
MKKNDNLPVSVGSEEVKDKQRILLRYRLDARAVSSEKSGIPACPLDEVTFLVVYSMYIFRI